MRLECSSVDGLSGSAARTASACSNQIRGAGFEVFPGISSWDEELTRGGAVTSTAGKTASTDGAAGAGCSSGFGCCSWAMAVAAQRPKSATRHARLLGCLIIWPIVIARLAEGQNSKVPPVRGRGLRGQAGRLGRIAAGLCV